MRNCGNCANYNHERLCHTDVCGKCFVEGANGKCGTPSKWKPKPLTNADRIRAMSDEELAKEFESMASYCAPGTYPNVEICRIERCVECWLNWLKQPVKEEKYVGITD